MYVCMYVCMYVRVLPPHHLLLHARVVEQFSGSVFVYCLFFILVNIIITSGGVLYV